MRISSPTPLALAALVCCGACLAHAAGFEWSCAAKGNPAETVPLKMKSCALHPLRHFPHADWFNTESRVPGVPRIFVNHFNHFAASKEKLEEYFHISGVEANWLGDFDRHALTEEAATCMFGDESSRMSFESLLMYWTSMGRGETPPSDALRSVAKMRGTKHVMHMGSMANTWGQLAMLTKMVEEGWPVVFVMDDDPVFDINPTQMKEELTTMVQCAQSLPGGFDLLHVGSFDSGYLLSQEGARKLLALASETGHAGLSLDFSMAALETGCEGTLAGEHLGVCKGPGQCSALRAYHYANLAWGNLNHSSWVETVALVQKEQRESGRDILLEVPGAVKPHVQTLGRMISPKCPRLIDLSTATEQERAAVFFPTR